MDERYVIDTPENIDFSYTIAGIGSRFLAAIIDTFILILAQLLLLGLLFVVISQLESLSDGVANSTQSIIFALWGLLSFIALWGYYIAFELLWNGQSPGKRAIRLRVVRDGGRPVTFGASAIRNLIRIIDFLPGLYGLGVLTMFIDRQARRLGDLAGGTLVVKERTAISLDSLVGGEHGEHGSSLERWRLDKGKAEASESPSDFTPTIPNLERITTKDYDLIQEFLRRRKELSFDSRQRLSSQLAEGMSNRLGIALKPENYESFLEHVVEEFRATTPML